ncbi:trypsin-like serine peptidase [Bradyrhizobium yuanmingense]|uniref:trypsin-like serine peptidase n=1 Tax=Bradyrhizobium yuanmingense TaxID=108015 RepID=UPI0023B96AAE|nr:trypsin-like peptidase domain-containing protein [Bradyrhizobium yuanmingense]MDF0495735.1 trypsin-like peptidase domain-containing protein [Bradyrhizobium yuanmingense]
MSGRLLRRYVNAAIRNRKANTENATNPECATFIESVDGSDAPSRETVEEAISILEEKLTKAAGGRDRLTDSDRLVISQSRKVGDKLLAEGVTAGLSVADEMALEAIAIADGTRPPLLIKDNAIAPDDPMAGDWADELKSYAKAIAEISPRIGRIDNHGRQLGTGWMIRPGYVVTNRHVAQELSKDPTAPLLELSPLRKATICFGFEADEPKQRPQHAISKIIYCGDKHIDRRNVDLALLDLAILKLEHTNANDLPSPLPSVLVPSEEMTVGSDLYAIGYPGTTASSRLPQSTLLRLFNDQLGVKRLSPGEIVLGLEGVDKSTKRTIGHDATTLGGSSGSVLLGFDSLGEPKVAGLHFSGYEVRYGPDEIEYRGRNYAHCFAAMHDVIRAVDRAIAEDRSR